MDILIREVNGVEKTWYSEDYLKNQIKQAYKAGIHKGIRVEFHSVVPMDSKSVENLTGDFKNLVDEEYRKAYSNDEVFRISK